MGNYLGAGILFALGSLFVLAAVGNWGVEKGVVSRWLTNGLPLLLIGTLLIGIGWRGFYVRARKLDGAAR